MMKYKISQNSDTQRVTLNFGEPGSPSVLISKEWRKSKEEPWILGKSVELSLTDLHRISSIMEAIFDSRVELYEGKAQVKDFEKWGVENG